MIPLNRQYVPSITKEFLFAGKSVFTVRDMDADKSFVFSVRGQYREFPAGSGKNVRVFFLNVKAPGGKYPFRYIGMLQPDGLVLVTARSEFKPDTKEYITAAWACQTIINHVPIDKKYEIEHNGYCGRCARDIKSLMCTIPGIGPECVRHI